MSQVAGRQEVASRILAMRRDPWGLEIPADDEDARGYAELVVSVRRLLAAVAACAAAGEDSREMARALDDVSARAEAQGAGERRQLHGRIPMAGAGSIILPPFGAIAHDDSSVTGTVVFDRHFSGANWAAHGGTIPLLFDDVMGRLVGPLAPSGARTAYLRTEYHAITPIGVDVAVHCEVERVEGRKIFVRGELSHGETCTASAEALFVVVRPGQP